MPSKEYLIYLYSIAKKWYGAEELTGLRDQIYGIVDGNFIPEDFWYYKFSNDLPNEYIQPFNQWKRENNIKQILDE